MRDEIDLMETAAGYRMSNPCVTAVVALQASLQMFDEVGMHALLRKSRQLTGYLAELLTSEFMLTGDKPPFRIITPPDARGCQLSLVFEYDIDQVFKRLSAEGVVCDERKPDCIRVAPAPMYNSF